MTSDSLLLIGIGGFIGLLAQSGILHAAVGMAGGEYIEERNSYPTAFFVTLLQVGIALGLRFLVLQGSLDRVSAIVVVFAVCFFVTMFAFRLGPLRALLVLFVASVLAALLIIMIGFLTRPSGVFSSLGRVLPLV